MMEKVKENNREFLKSPVGERKDDFAERMMMRNDIPGLIPVSIREFNGEAFYYFDTTARKPFSEMFTNENDVMNKEDVECICKSIIRVSESLREYLLDTEGINLAPETFFFNTETGMYDFLYIPSGGNKAGDFRGGIRQVWERVLKKFKQDSDRDFIMKLYDMYQKISVDNFNPESIFKLPPVQEPPTLTLEEKKPEIKEEDLYDKEKVEEIIETEEIQKKAPGKRKKYAMYGSLVAAAVIILAVVV